MAPSNVPNLPLLAPAADLLQATDRPPSEVARFDRCLQEPTSLYSPEDFDFKEVPNTFLNKLNYKI